MMLTPGFFPSNYWPGSYFSDNYWPDYGPLLRVVTGGITPNGCALTFTDYTAVTSATHAEVHRSESSPVAGDGTTLIADDITTGSFVDNTADSDTTYHYVLVYKDVSDAEVGRTNELEITTTVGGVVKNLTFWWILG